MVSKSEKVNITVGGKTGAAAQAQPQINTFKRNGHVKLKTEASDESVEADSPVKDQSGRHALLDHPDVKDLDGGFAADMYQPGEKIAPKEKVPQPAAMPVEHETVFSEPAATTEAEPTAITEVEPDETSENENFYTSKLDPSQAKHPKHKHPTRPAGKARPYTLVRFWIILLVFLLTAATGFVMLYQLEQVNAGSGIIFDWVNWQ